MADIQRWEYWLCPLVYGPPTLGQGGDVTTGMADWLAHLNEAGDAGWEAVGQIPLFRPTSPAPLGYLLMKHPKPTED